MYIFYTIKKYERKQSDFKKSYTSDKSEMMKFSTVCEIINKALIKIRVDI